MDEWRQRTWGEMQETLAGLGAREVEKRRRCTESSAENGHKERHEVQAEQAMEHGEGPADIRRVSPLGGHCMKHDTGGP